MSDYNFDELYPNRFMKAGLFKGKVVTLTIVDVEMEELPDKKGKNGRKKKPVLSFKETELQLIANKTNGLALMVMFGKLTKDWKGKRVAFFPEKGKYFGKKQEAIRVYGSPDIAQDITEEVRLGNEMETYKLKKTTWGKQQPAPQPEPEPEIEEGSLDPLTGEVPFGEDEQAQILAQEAGVGT